MDMNGKKLLIVDDSEIDRLILKTILEDDFEIKEAENGYAAIEMLSRKMYIPDAILLDISMPLFSGFDVLRMIRDKQLVQCPVFLITSEATKDNVMRAAEFSIAEFISKPFDREDVLKRVRTRLGVIASYHLTMDDIQETKKYISSLESIFRSYLSNFNKDGTHYERMAALMKIMLNRYRSQMSDVEITKEKIDIISRAAYLSNIGIMLIPDKLSVISKKPENLQVLTKYHTRLGADIVRLNTSKQCRFFVDVCADMCNNHHERYDGGGYPSGNFGRNISAYSQMCRLADEFDTIFSRLYGANELQASYVINRIIQDEGLASPEMLSLLEGCSGAIAAYYKELMPKG